MHLIKSEVNRLKSLWQFYERQRWQLKYCCFYIGKSQNSCQYQCDFKRIADVTITRNLTRVLSNTLMTQYERIVNILKIPLKWKKINVRQKILKTISVA